MSNQIWKNGKRMFLAQIIITVILTIILFIILAYNIVVQHDAELKRSIDKLEENARKSTDDADKSYESFENVNISKARLAAYYIRRGKDDPERWTIKHIAELLNVDDVMIVNKEGEIIASASGTADVDFSDSRYEDITNILGSPNEYGFVYDDYGLDTESYGNYYHIYFAAKLDSSNLVVLDVASSKLERDLISESSWEELVERSLLANNGVVFITNINGDIEFSSNKEANMAGNIEEFGVDVSNLRNYWGSYMKIGEDGYYVESKWLDEYKKYIIVGTSSVSIVSTITVTLVVTVFVIFVSMFVLIFYSIVVLRENISRKKSRRHVMGDILDKTKSVAFICAAAIIAVSIYMQMLYTLSLQSMSNSEDITALGRKLDKNDIEIGYRHETYKNDVLDRARLAASFISNNRDIVNTTTMSQLRDILNVEHILVYDKTGKVISSDGTYYGLTPSLDPNDMSNEFRKLTFGIPYVYQDEPDPDYLDEEYQYAGVVLTDSDKNADGFVQLALDPGLLATYMESTTLKSVLDSYSGNNSSFAFTVNKESGEFSYFPTSRYIGKSAEQCGVPMDKIYDGYSGYINIDAGRYFVSCLEGEKSWLFVATNHKNISKKTFARALNVAVVGLGAFIIMYLLVIIIGSRGMDKYKPEEAEKEQKNTAYHFVLRKMGNASANERMLTYIKILCLVFSGITTIVILFRSVIFKSNSVFNYIMNMKWDKGLHIFAITACILTAVWVLFAEAVLLRLLTTIGKLTGANGITICRMLSSFIKYIVVIGLAYFCLNILGAKPNALLVSAGILSMIVALGAQSLVSDVIAGFFIVFENEFRVGDMVRIDDYRGVVQEIGIRTTKVRDIDTNYVRVFENSKLQSVINLSHGYIYSYLYVNIDYAEDVKRIEEIIEKDMPTVRQGLIKQVHEAKFLGVNNFQDSAIQLIFKVTCKEEDLLPVRRSMNREIRLMFARNNIEIPFNQIVVSERKEHEQEPAIEQSQDQEE